MALGVDCGPTTHLFEMWLVDDVRVKEDRVIFRASYRESYFDWVLLVTNYGVACFNRDVRPSFRSRYEEVYH